MDFRTTLTRGLFFPVVVLCLGAVAAGQQPTPQQKWAKLEPMVVPLPAGAIAFHFGGHNFPGMKRVTSGTEYSDEAGFGFVKPHDLSNTGNYGWPTTFHQALVFPEASGVDFEFKVKVPPGAYFAHLTYSSLIRPDMTDIRYQLKLNDWTIMDDAPTPEQFNSEKYLYRFLWTQYSERPDAIWRNYLRKMYISETHLIDAPDGVVSLKGINQVLYALILLPADRKAQFEQFVKTLDQKLLDSYHDGAYYLIAPQTKPQKQSGDGDYLVYLPNGGQVVMPWTGPTPEERTRTAIKRVGVRGQRLAVQIAVVPFAELGKSTLELADLKGPAGTIPKSAIQGYFKNYSYGGVNKVMIQAEDVPGRASIAEMILLPSLTLEMEKGVTQNYWLWMQIPSAASPGVYRGTFTFRPGTGKATGIPVAIEVYDFALEEDPPLAFGTYGWGADPTLVDETTRRKVMTERFQIMRELGFNGFSLHAPLIRRAEDGTLSMTFDRLPLEVAKAVGMGRNAQQAMMVENFFLLGRYIGYRMPGSKGPEDIDATPGKELTLAGFDDLFVKFAADYKKALDAIGLPIVANIVDEPREMYINPWNRNFADSMKYIALTRNSGNWRIAMNPMGDICHYANKDYTPFIDACDVMSTHSWPRAEKIMKLTPEKGKTLWLYNCGLDRFTWGFYNWKVRSSGRWEWHFAFPQPDSSFREYKSAEWYNPFSSNYGFGPPAPYAKYRGGVLFQSGVLEAAEGINDTRYIRTLETAMAKSGRDPASVTKAKALLESIRAEIPDYPKVEGLGTGTGVGAVKADRASALTESWRQQIAELLKVLAN